MSNNNISFLLEEKDNNDNENENDEFDFSNFINEMDELTKDNNYNYNNNNSELLYYVEKSVFTNEDETYYSEKYTIKDLMKICCYYGIDKNIKSSKCRKQDIIATIVFFEGQIENANIVYKRHNMWAYMTELIADPKMRAYLLWP
jgi:hypothetical protein